MILKYNRSHLFLLLQTVEFNEFREHGAFGPEPHKDSGRESGNHGAFTHPFDAAKEDETEHAGDRDKRPVKDRFHAPKRYSEAFRRLNHEAVARERHRAARPLKDNTKREKGVPEEVLGDLRGLRSRRNRGEGPHEEINEKAEKENNRHLEKIPGELKALSHHGPEEREEKHIETDRRGTERERREKRDRIGRG